jgi:hypothetical protein
MNATCDTCPYCERLANRFWCHHGPLGTVIDDPGPLKWWCRHHPARYADSEVVSREFYEEALCGWEETSIQALAILRALILTAISVCYPCTIITQGRVQRIVNEHLEAAGLSRIEEE